MAETKESCTLAFADAMLFAVGRCASRAGMAGMPCHLPVADNETDKVTREGRYCTAHQEESR
jgi:hypothetical protein